MGPKLKRKIVRERISAEEKQERKRVLARQRQQRRRARLIGGEEEGKEWTESDIVGFGSSETFQGTPEEISVEVDIKEECLSNNGDENSEEGNMEEEPESELLPGFKGQQLYYDGVGFYYTQLYEDVTYRWLTCSHSDCSVMAQMKRHDKAPIHLVAGVPQHNHLPNPARRDRILFLHTIKTRHANENTPFSEIFQQEAHKNPVGAGFFSFDKIQAHLQKKISLGGSENLSKESVLSAASKLSMMTRRSRPSPDEEPVVKKMRTDKVSPPSDKLSKKLQLLKSLKDVSFTECQISEPITQLPTKPSERLPGPHPHSYIYHDGNGYFYKPLSISGNTRYLRCNSNGCNAQAVMALDENAPIALETDSPAHNHPPQAQTSKSPSLLPSLRPCKVTSSGIRKKTDNVIVEEAENQEDKKMQASKVVLNKKPASPQKKRSEKIDGPEYYYDFKGHYYFSTRVDQNKRYLRCIFPTCLAHTYMTLEDNAEIQPLAGSRPHNHDPDFSSKYHSKIKQWEEQLADCLPSERLPSFRIQYCCYHDGKGFYYHQTSQADNIRHLACAEPTCPVKAHMCTQKDAPITISSLRMGHSHNPDHTLREALLFIDAVRVRARSDNAPATAIFLESVRNPVGAARVDLETLKLCLEKAALIANKGSNEGITEDEVDFVSCLKPQKAVKLKPSTESQVPVPNHFTSPRPILGDGHQSKDKGGSDTKSELVPALFSESWLLHDGCGYYYNTKSTNNGCRYLQCVLPKCGAQALAGQIGGPVKLKKPHSHGPQPPQHRAELWFFHKVKTQAQNNIDTPLERIYKEVAQKDPGGAALMSKTEVLQLMDKFLMSVIQGKENENSTLNRSSVFIPPQTPAEKLPNWTLGRCQYHDGQGYYYTVSDSEKKSSNAIFRQLQCIARPACPARASLVKGMVKINGSSGHNHKPDLIHRDICLFSHALKKRARDEHTSISIIYEEEAKNYPNAAAVLQEDKLKGKLISIRRYVRREVNAQAEEGEVSLNDMNQSRSSSVASEVFSGKTGAVYYDGRGYYYHETFKTNHLRYLMCCEPHCLAQAEMGLRAGAPVVGQVGAPRHCHAPDPLRRNCLLLVDNIRRRAAQRKVKVETIILQEAAKEPIVAAQIPKEYLMNLVKDVRIVDKKEYDLWTVSEPCERLPSEHGWLYVDGSGYYFYCQETYKSRRTLRCCEDGCEATAWLEGLRVTRAPGSVMHNHTPEPRRRSMLLLLHRLATRAQHEHTSVTNIYEEEAMREPEGAALIQKNQLNETLRSLAVSRYFKELEEEELCQKENISEEKFNASEVSSMPCEMLHSASSGKPVYHDKAGHYFTELRKTLDKQYVKCLMPLCDARGFVVQRDPEYLHIPVSWAEHNHQAEPRYRNKLIFIHSLRERALKENTPVDVIYREESGREPVGADLVSEVFLKNMLYKLRKYKSAGDKIDEFPYEGVTDDQTTEPVSEGMVEQVVEPPSECQIDQEKVSKDIANKEDSTEESALVQVKVEAMEAAEDGDDEYGEEEYLEEERLEDALLMETPVMMTIEQTATDVYLPSEKLPSRSPKAIFHNGQGYYFQINTVKDNNMYLRCIEPRCKVRGIKLADSEDAPIIPTKDCVIHNHRPDFTRRTQLLFIQHCKERAATEINLTINDIWESEVQRDPDTASQFSAYNIKAQMKRYRQEQAANSEILSEEETLGQNSEDGTTFHDASITDPMTENDSHVDIHQGAVPEKIPSLLGDTLWHAAGYFYSTHDLSGSVEKVKCVEKECVARAQVTLGDRGQPVGIRLIKNTAHCHPEDLQRRDLLLFIDRCKRRAATTLQSVEEIYHDEAAMSPEIAAQLSAVRVKRAMGVAKKAKLKKGIRLDSKEVEDTGASGDHGMSELGEMANVVQTPAAGHREEAGASDSGAQDDSDYNYEETLDDTDDLWTIDPRSLTREEKKERKKAFARERQRRRRQRMIENPDRWEQLEKEKENARQRAFNWNRQRMNRLMKEQAAKKGQDDTDSEPKTAPKLGPKFLKEDFHEQEELVDQTYSDYVTLEEEVDSFEKGTKNDVEEEEVVSSITTNQTQEDYELEEAEPKNKKGSHLVHGRRVNSYSYHDGNGFFYDTQTISEKYRHLTCVVVGCKAQGYMALEQEDGPINLTRQSPAHFHPPDPRHKDLVHFVTRCEARALNEDMPLKEIYDEEVELDPVSASKLVQENMLQRMLKIRNKSKELSSSATEDAPDNAETVTSEHDEESGQVLTDEEDDRQMSEVLPGYRPNSTIYYDMNGYYFIFNALKESKRYLRCIEPLCRVRGSMQLYDGAPIRTNPNIVHNHRPDFQRKNFLLFLQACKERAVREDLPLARIYQEECDKDPVSATMISTQNLLQRMQRARKLTVQYYPTHEDQNEFTEACNSNTITTDIPPHELVEEDVQAQEEVEENVAAETVTDEDDPGDEDPESEAIERAISRRANSNSAEDGSKDGGPMPEDQLQPPEVLPGIRPNSTMYHDGRGYYYLFNNQSENVWYLRCLEPQCRVRAHMQPMEDIPIIQSPNTVHNHRPDFRRKQLVLWMEQAKHRAITEDLPISTIYAQEAARDPESANMVSQENMKTRLYRARKSLVSKLSSGQEAAADENSEEDEDQQTVVMVADSEYGQVHDSEAVSSLQTEESEDGNTVYVYQSSNSTAYKRATYVDENGFYYQQTTVRNNTRYLKCAEAGCKARASMGLEEDSVITLSKQGCHHNHTVEQSQLAMLLDPSASDSVPIQVIYTDENGGEQVTLCHFKDEVEHPKPHRLYRQRHKPELTIDPEEPVEASTVCEVDVAEDLAEGDYYHNEDQQQYPLKPSEVIPGLRPDANNYHDGNGFYYELNRLSPNIRYLKCLIKDCKARAYMELGKENAPIIQTNFARHNHGPDLTRKQFTVFLHRVTRRAAEEDTPIHVIYRQEAERDPLSAGQIRMENVKQRMMRFRKKHRQNINMSREALSASEMDMDGSICHLFMEDEKPELTHHGEGEGVQEEEGEEERECVTEEEGEGVKGEDGEELLYESYVVSEVEVESQQQQE